MVPAAARPVAARPLAAGGTGATRSSREASGSLAVPAATAPWGDGAGSGTLAGPALPR